MGSGLMGSGIAEVSARAGYRVQVWDINEAAVKAGQDRISASLRQAVSRGKLTEGAAVEVRGRISYVWEIAEVTAPDLVVEAVLESVATKRDVFSRLDGQCPPETIFASNTSSLCIIEIASATRRMHRFGGMHFFSPVPVMPLVEITRTIVSDDDTVETLMAFGRSVGKTPILCKDSPGFVVNRLLIPYLLDAIRAYESGLASREDIDAGMKLGCGHPMGPLTLSDFVGLDVLCSIANILFEEFREPRFAPPPLLKRMVLAGQLGRKTKKGFYDY